MVRFASLFNVKEQTVTFVSGATYSLEELRAMGMSELLGAMFDFSHKLAALELNVQELGLFTAVVLVSAGEDASAGRWTRCSRMIWILQPAQTARINESVTLLQTCVLYITTVIFEIIPTFEISSSFISCFLDLFSTEVQFLGTCVFPFFKTLYFYSTVSGIIYEIKVIKMIFMMNTSMHK